MRTTLCFHLLPATGYQRRGNCYCYWYCDYYRFCFCGRLVGWSTVIVKVNWIPITMRLKWIRLDQDWLFVLLQPALTATPFPTGILVNNDLSTVTSFDFTHLELSMQFVIGRGTETWLSLFFFIIIYRVLYLLIFLHIVLPMIIQVICGIFFLMFVKVWCVDVGCWYCCLACGLIHLLLNQFFVVDWLMMIIITIW